MTALKRADLLRALSAWDRGIRLLLLAGPDESGSREMLQAATRALADPDDPMAVVDLPAEALRGLSKDHLMRMDIIVEMEKPIEIFARLNVKHGPNTAQIVRELPLNEAKVAVEFDLAYSDINEKRIEKAWMDLIFEGPEMNMVTLRDVTFSRRMRAAI